MIDLDISIVTFNSAAVLPRLLASLLQQRFDLARIGLSFVDNDSADDTVALLERWGDEHAPAFGAFHLSRGANVGFGAGQNRAVAAGSAPFVFVLNPDTELPAECVERLHAAAVADDERVAAWEARQLPYEHPKVYDAVTLEVPWFSGACVLVRRSAFAAVGGFDPAYFLYCEDVDLSWRLRAAGWRLRYVPRAVIWHYSYATPGEIKPAQLAGSTIGNLCLRTRFGTQQDFAEGLRAYVELLLSPPGMNGIRRQLLGNLTAFLGNYSHFRNRGTTFRFFGWDYSPRRIGDFYESVSCDGFTRRPKVSILVRTIGRLPLLRRALATIANQTYAPIEVVVVEDGSARARDIAAEFPTLEIVYVPLERNVGRSAAGNVALARATGDYCNFLDEDDELYADHVEQLVGALLRSGRAAAYAVAFEVPSRIAGDDVTEEGDASVVYRGPMNRLEMFRNNQLPIQCVLFARALFAEHGGFDVELDTLEDWHLWLRYLGAAGDFAFVDKTTSRYRVPLDRTIFAARRKKLDDDYAAFVKKARLIRFDTTVGELAAEVDGVRRAEAASRPPQPAPPGGMTWGQRAGGWLRRVLRPRR
jgi:GT2 family glycosyltransferase